MHYLAPFGYAKIQVRIRNAKNTSIMILARQLLRTSQVPHLKPI